MQNNYAYLMFFSLHLALFVLPGRDPQRRSFQNSAQKQCGHRVPIVNVFYQALRICNNVVNNLWENYTILNNVPRVVVT